MTVGTGDGADAAAATDGPSRVGMPSLLPEGRTAVSRERRREIIDTAAEVFFERGYAKASMQDVADRVGILKGSLYHYISGKEDLLYQLLVETNESAMEIIDELDGRGLHGRAALHAFVIAYTAYNCRNRVKVGVYYRDFGLVSEHRRAAVLRQRARFEDYLATQIRRAQTDGEVGADRDVRLSVLFVFGATNWCYRWFDPAGPRTPEQIGVEYADMIVDSLGRAGS